MAYVTSIINLKGGVGKTTITLALAHFLALEHRKRVLVIDLDPQTNATVCLIPEMEWKKRDETGRTLYQLFWDQLKGTHMFSAEESIVRRVSNVGWSGASSPPVSWSEARRAEVPWRLRRLPGPRRRPGPRR